MNPISNVVFPKKSSVLIAWLIVVVVGASAQDAPRLEISLSGSNAVLRWSSQPSQRFDVLRATTVGSNSVWFPLAGNVAAGSSITEFTHTNALAAPTAFYRVNRNDEQSFTFTWSGTNFIYSDPDRSFTGIMLKPDGAGPFPAVLIQHGAGGSVTNYSVAKARDMTSWGFVSIAPNLTHVTGGETNVINMGFCPENLARAEACLRALVSLSFIDTNRIALFGHSMGAFATIGDAAVFGPRIRAVAISAGGVIPDSAGATNAAPIVSEASGITAPTLMLHCDADPVVLPSRSALLQSSLNGWGVTNQRQLISSNTLPQNTWHNIHQDAGGNQFVLTNTRAWFESNGVLVR